MTRAEVVLSKQSGDVSQAMMLLQKVATKKIVPVQATRGLSAPCRVSGYHRWTFGVSIIIADLVYFRAFWIVLSAF